LLDSAAVASVTPYKEVKIVTAMDDSISWDELGPLMHEVRIMARSLLKRESDSWSTTALVLTALRRQRHAHQDWSEVTWQNRQHFLRSMYREMLRALVDHSRRRSAMKRGGIPIVPLPELQLENLPRVLEEAPEYIIALSEALEQLQTRYPELLEVVEHRVYGGLTVGEIARIMGTSESTVKRKWTKARLLLHDHILNILNTANIERRPSD
jgi:RNA polymerase sigma-70 factor, ECF subfamily